MAKDRTDDHTQESGVALVAALLITLVVMMLIVSLTFFFVKGFRANILNRNFSTVYEAANGGVEYTAGLIQTYLGGTTLTDLGAITMTGGANFADIMNCTNIADSATVRVGTADNKYTITIDVQCLGTQGVPGFGGWQKFPPPAVMTGGGVGTGRHYNFYRMIANANETSGSESYGRTEAVYRVVQ